MKTKHVITILMVLISGLGIVSCDDDNERFFLYQIDEVVFPDQAISSTATVSYTHLTLPTKLEV